MRPQWSSLRDRLTTALALCLAAVSWTAAAARDASVWAWKTVRDVTARLASDAETGLRESRRLLDGPVRTLLLGRRAVVSVLAGLLAAPLALGSAWWVDANVGYDALTELVAGTWYGTNPELGVFLAAAVLVGLGAVSAGLNSGLVPTTGLVVAPIFGAALTRYGTTVPTYGGGTAVVSLPEAVASAAYVGLVLGVPIAVGGFLLGTALRRIGVVVTDIGGPSRPAEQA